VVLQMAYICLCVTTTGCLFLPLHLFNIVSHHILCALLCSPQAACVLLTLYLFHTGMHLMAMSAVSSLVWCPHWEYSEKENLPHHHCQERRCGTCSCCRHGMIGPAPVKQTGSKQILRPVSLSDMSCHDR